MKKLLLFFVFSFFFFCIGQSRAYMTTAVKTDSLVYSSGQEIFIYFTIKNHGPDTLQFNWPTSCQAIYSIDGQKADLACYAVLTELTLYPDSSFTWVFKHTQEIFPIYPGTHILKVEVIDYEQYFAFNNFSTAFLKLTDQSKKICTEDSSFIKLAVVDDTLKFFWQTPALNSCLEPLWGGWLKADTFHLAMVDTGAPCDCDCENHFHLTADFASFPDGHYVLDFADGVYGYPIFDIGVVGIREEIIPGSVALFQNYPNPFNPEAVIGYRLVVIGNVELTVYNILGQKVRTLVNQKQKAGVYRVSFNGEGLPGGIYFYRLILSENGNSTVQTKRMLLLK
jgi:hypothetical protein